MQLNLRQAHELQTRINSTVKELQDEMELHVDLFYEGEPAGVLSNMTNKAFADLEPIQKLLMIKAELRTKVAKKNAQAGIDERLSQIASLQRMIEAYERVMGRGMRQELFAVKERLDSRREAHKANPDNGDRYSCSDSFNVDVLDKKDHAEMKSRVKKFRREIRDMQEQILQLNVNTYVTLEQGIVLLGDLEIS